MKRNAIFILSFILGLTLQSAAQEAFMAGDGVAVFYPAGFDSAKTLPSFSFTKPLERRGKLPPNWKLVPVFSTDSGKTIAKLYYDGNADLYGNGEVTGPLRRNGTRVKLWNTDNFFYGKDSGSRLYQAHPWLMGVRKDGTAFGIIADHTWKQEFNCSNPVTIVSEGPAFRVIIIEKKDPAALLSELAKLTGKMPLPPLWALGYQQSRYSYFPAGRVMEIAGEFRKRKLPADVIWMDIDYMQNYKVFTFDSAGFNKPAMLNNDLHRLHFKSVYMIDPGVKKEEGYTVYEQGSKGNHWVTDKNGKEFNGKVWPGPCAFPDFTRPATRAWWGTLYKDFMATGIDGIWNDMNEPSVFDGPDGTMPPDNIHRGGGGLYAGNHLRYHNAYGLLMVKASREGILAANPAKRPFVLSRSNFLGGQQYAATWTGDNVSTWEHFKMSIPMVLNLGLSGQPFSGPDLGGFGSSPDADLFSNWISVGAFYPFCRNHSSKNSKDQEPWAFGEKVEEEARTALNRRYRLLPYLYTLFWEASNTGMPVMRPVFFADFVDTSLRREESAFMLGKDIIIVPGWSKRPSLPRGLWRPLSFESEKPGSLAIQPELLMRGGSVIPLTASSIQNTDEYQSDSITLLVCLDKNQKAEGQLYIDAGEGFAYQKGDYEVWKYKAQKNLAGEVIVQGKKTSGNRKNKKRYYRVGLVAGDGIRYTGWIKDARIVIQ